MAAAAKAAKATQTAEATEVTEIPDTALGKADIVPLARNAWETRGKNTCTCSIYLRNECLFYGFMGMNRRADKQIA